MDTAKYKALFVSEAREYLREMSQEILSLTQSHAVAPFDRLFRSAHSMKGMAASMGYVPLKDLGHQLEDLLDSLKKGERTLNEDIKNILLLGVDLMSSMVGEIEQIGISTTTAEAFVAALSGLEPVTKIDAAPERRLEIIAASPRVDSKEQNKYFYKIELKVSEESSMPAARALIAYKRIEELGKISRSNPALEEIMAGHFGRDFSCYMVTSYTGVEIQQILKSLPDVSDLFITPIDPFTRQAPVAESDQPPSFEGLKVRDVRVNLRNVDRVLEGLGELLILNAQVQESFPKLPQISKLQTLTQQLYEQASALRMMPFETLSSSFPRIVHELSKRLQKKVRLKVEGIDIQMDKSILEDLAVPLVHLLRNSMDHGIETPQMRLAYGKDETGTITISVERQGTLLLIRVEDDGRGVDPRDVKKAAVRQGFISERAADFLNEQETFLLMTRPGFSTANEVSDVSGRGVGLDIVRSKIDSLGGQLKIHSIPGSFTRFDIVVPFTLAVIRVFIVRSGSNLYAIPFSHIERFLQFKKAHMHYTQGRPVYFYENSTMFVEDLEALLSGNRSPEFAEELFVCVSEHQNRRIAWCIDEIVAEKQILVRPLAEPLSLLGCYTGATVLGRGDVIAILDLEQLYRESFQ